jgi:hypothetical protein
MQFIEELVPVVLKHFHFEKSSLQLQSQFILDVYNVLVELSTLEDYLLYLQKIHHERFNYIFGSLNLDVVGHNRQNRYVFTDEVSMNCVHRFTVSSDNFLPMLPQAHRKNSPKPLFRPFKELILEHYLYILKHFADDRESIHLLCSHFLSFGLYIHINSLNSLAPEFAPPLLLLPNFPPF